MQQRFLNLQMFYDICLKIAGVSVLAYFIRVQICRFVDPKNSLKTA
jgi:hypothetical protein